MAIEFHCQHCGKQVRTGDEHAGRRGKCPYCHNSVYIPTPSDQIEPLTLAPIDRVDEAEQKRLDDESRGLAQSILHEKGGMSESRGDTQRDEPDTEAGLSVGGPPPVGDARLDAANMEYMVIQYAVHMAQGDLAAAEHLAVQIRGDMPAAEEVMQRLTADEIPPTELADVPRPVLVGFFKQLREKKRK